MDSVESNECLINENLARGSLRHVAYQGEPPFAKEATGHAYVDFRKVAEFHRDVYGVGQDGDSFAMADGPRDLGRRCAGAYRNGVAVRNEACGNQAYPAFFGSAPVLLVTE